MFLSRCSPASSNAACVFSFELAPGIFRQHHLTWAGDPFETRSDVDSVAINVFVLVNDVADMDTDAESDGVVSERLLNRDRAINRVDHAVEFHQPAVAHAFDHVAPMGGDQRLEGFLPQSPQGRQRTRLVLLHHAGIPDDIGSKNRR